MAPRRTIQRSQSRSYSDPLTSKMRSKLSCGKREKKTVKLWNEDDLDAIESQHSQEEKEEACEHLEDAVVVEQVDDCNVEKSDSMTSPFKVALAIAAKKTKTSPGMKSGCLFAAPDKATMTKNFRNRNSNELEALYGRSLFAIIAGSNMFESLGLVVISMNALWIAVETDCNDAPALIHAEMWVQAIENSFCLFFTTEICIRFMAFQTVWGCLGNVWFCFDSALVFVMVMETWFMNIILVMTGATGQLSDISDAAILRLLRLVRLTRMARMVRLFRAVPELMVLIKGMAAATRSVFFTVLLLLAVIYFFGIVFTQLSTGTHLGKTHFSTVARSMYTLLLRGCYMDEITQIMNEMLDENILFVILFLTFVFLGAHTVLNMLIGVLCEVVTVIASTEKWDLLLSFVEQRLVTLLTELGMQSNCIKKDDFVVMLRSEKAARILREVGVDSNGLVDLVDLVFDSAEEHESLTFAEFMDVCLQFRGTNHATVKDLVEQRKFFQGCFTDFTDRIEILHALILELQQTGGGQRRGSSREAIKSSNTTVSVEVKCSNDIGVGTADLCSKGGDGAVAASVWPRRASAESPICSGKNSSTDTGCASDDEDVWSVDLGGKGGDVASDGDSRTSDGFNPPWNSRSVSPSPSSRPTSTSRKSDGFNPPWTSGAMAPSPSSRRSDGFNPPWSFQSAAPSHSSRQNDKMAVVGRTCFDVQPVGESWPVVVIQESAVATLAAGRLVEEPEGLFATAERLLDDLNPVATGVSKRRVLAGVTSSTSSETFLPKRSAPSCERTVAVSEALEACLLEINLSVARGLKEAQCRARERLAAHFDRADSEGLGCSGVVSRRPHFAANAASRAKSSTSPPRTLGMEGGVVAADADACAGGAYCAGGGLRPVANPVESGGRFIPSPSPCEGFTPCDRHASGDVGNIGA